MKTRENMDALRDAISEIASRNGGTVTAEAVLAAARNKKSALHAEFEWDDKKAAHEHRLDQARALIRSVKVEITTETTIIKTVAYVRDPDLPAEDQGYVSIASLRGDADRARAAIVAEFSRAAAALRRAREIAIALDMADEVDAITESIQVVRTKVEARVEARGITSPLRA